MEKKFNIPLLIGGIVLVVVIAGGTVALSLSRPDTSSSASITTPTPTLESATTPNSTTTPASSAATATPSATTSSNTKFKDGTYTASGTYVSPDGDQSIGVSLVVSKDSITSVTVTPKSSDRQSKGYQQDFAGGINSIVVGKPLSSTFDVSQVNGSSLTGEGFTKALEAIRSQAAS